ncbi:hypothetical protein GGQ18_000027 [Salinibacter ruber]|nr:hypothetical protein [Salinibacter ruber]
MDIHSMDGNPQFFNPFTHRPFVLKGYHNYRRLTSVLQRDIRPRSIIT